MPSTAVATAAFRPTALISRRQATEQRARFARDTARAVGYLLLTHVVVPLMAALVLMGTSWSRWAMVATIPVSTALGVAYGFEQRREPVKVSWHLPNAVQVFRWTWQYADRDLIVNFRVRRHHRIWLWTAAGVAGAVWCWSLGSLAVAGLVSAAGLVRFLRLQPAKVVYTPPHSAPRIREAMLATGVWTVTTLPPFDHLRPPETDDHGSTCWVSLHGKSYRDLEPQTHRLVAGFGLREKQLRVEHTDDLPADAICLRFNNGHPRAPREHWAAKLDEVVNWTQPQPIGVDAFGATHALHTTATHTAFFGKTRSGKTVAARGFVSYGLLDPRVEVVVFDGKNDASDWQPMRDLCTSYVGGSTSASIAAVERELLRLESVNNDRAGGDHGASAPVIVVVDEWFRIRQAAKRHDKKAAERIDGLMADLAATSSGRHVHLIFCAQRGTAEFLPGDLKANVGQRVQGWAATPLEIGYAIHSNPEVLPARTGEFLVSTDEGGTAELVQVPHLDGPAFAEVCRTARRLRAAAAPQPVDLVKHEQTHEIDDDRPASWQELVAVILQEADGPMTTTEIHQALPADARPTPYPERFGRFLTADASSDAPSVARTKRAGTRSWTLSDALLPALGQYDGPSARSCPT